MRLSGPCCISTPPSRTTVENQIGLAAIALVVSFSGRGHGARSFESRARTKLTGKQSRRECTVTSRLTHDWRWVNSGDGYPAPHLARWRGLGKAPPGKGSKDGRFGSQGRHATASPMVVSWALGETTWSSPAQHAHLVSSCSCPWSNKGAAHPFPRFLLSCATHLLSN
ncbi:hypothetical protein B0J18DRAFT_235219 [Chaetomium sp. MPI-SDFR-AT-0129]|nr:hypothetical protein B0J18DRAFT_235219 [Chaetomium sp. MPI-SDFR-AT-0129]